MKLYVYENLLSERFDVKEIKKTKNETYEKIFAELKLVGNFLIVENDEVKQYPSCLKDIPDGDAIIHVKRIPKKDAGTASWWLGGGNGVSGNSVNNIYMRFGSDDRCVANDRRSKRISWESYSRHI